MKIVSVETFPVRIGLKPKFRMISALGRHEVSDYVLVRVATDEGIEGVGEATVMVRWSGETVWSADTVIRHVLGPAIVGMDPFDVESIDARLDRVCAHNWFAKSALEMACWDIQGKAEGKPVYELLGGPVRDRAIRGRFSMGAYDVERARGRAEELVAEGFTTIKVKVGGTPADDVARVRAVREVIGPDLDLVVDANCGWTPDTAIEALQQMAELNLALIEQPTPNGDYEGMARVRAAVDPPIMADDICFNLVHAQELIRNECCDVISLYPGKNGGIRKSKAIADFAAQHGVACSIGSNLEWDIATAAMGHLVVGVENMRVEQVPGDIYGPIYHELRIARNPLQIEGPLTTIPEAPGLGVEVDWDLVRTHALRL